MPILEAITLSDNLGQRITHGRATVLLAEILMDFQMATRGGDIIDEARVDEVPGFAEWPEMMGWCRMTQARCLMATARPEGASKAQMSESGELTLPLAQTQSEKTGYILRVDGCNKLGNVRFTSSWVPDRH